MSNNSIKTFLQNHKWTTPLIIISSIICIIILLCLYIFAILQYQQKRIPDLKNKVDSNTTTVYTAEIESTNNPRILVQSGINTDIVITHPNNIKSIKNNTEIEGENMDISTSELAIFSNKTDELIAKEYALNHYDVYAITSGNADMNSLRTKGNNDN